MKWRMKDKRERNQRLLKFREEHPDYTLTSIARIFHLHPSRVCRILKAMKSEVLVE